jgi:molybdate/tungstate transport system ATP-binding protein
VIQLERVTVAVGRFRLREIDLEVPAGQYAVLMGRTGCGKTTLLEAICGLRRVEGGRIYLRDRDATHLRPGERGVGYVPQDRALFPTMTVRDHLAFGPVVHRWSQTAVAARVAELAGLLGLDHLLDRKPPGLSGGEAQRVALGRALAARPGVLCLDEPLSALDEATREDMYALLKNVATRTGVTTLHVTHHPAEAARLADRVVLLEDGRVVP